MSVENSYQLETLAVRAGTARSEFGEHSEAMFFDFDFRVRECRASRASLGSVAFTFTK